MPKNTTNGQFCCGRDFLELRQTAISTYYHITPVDEFEGN